MLNHALLIFATTLLVFGCRTNKIGSAAENGSDLRRLSGGREAAWQKISSSEFEMTDPPKDRSSAFKKDFEILHVQQASRSDIDCQTAESQKHPTFEAFFGSGTKQLTAREYERVSELMERVTTFSEQVAGYFKIKLGRTRPYDEDSTLKPCIAKPGGDRSYPSSHAAAAATDACVLAAIFPDKADELMKYGKHLGDLRYIVGVHHPSDVVAGQKLGQEICKRLLSDPSFQQELHSL
jgi:hypothetical protein